MSKIWRKITDIVHTTNGRLNHQNGGYAAVQDIALARRNGQLIFTHGTQEDRRLERRSCWYLWSTKEGREKVLSKMEIRTDEEDQTTAQDLVSVSSGRPLQEVRYTEGVDFSSSGKEEPVGRIE